MPETTPRTRTPPDLKWMLNERAALAGTLVVAEDVLLRLQGQRSSLERRLHVVEEHMELLEATRSTTAHSIAALDATLMLAYPQVSPDVTGPVRPSAGKYGKRGSLKAFVLQQIKAAAPAAVSMTVLCVAAERHFVLVLVDRHQRGSFRRTIGSYLLHAAKRGTVRSLHEVTAGLPGQWQWVAGPTLEALKQAVGSEQR